MINLDHPEMKKNILVYLQNAFSEILPYTVFGSLALLCGFLAIFLPETLNQPLPDTLPPRTLCNCVPIKLDQDRTQDMPLDDNLSKTAKDSVIGVNGTTPCDVKLIVSQDHDEVDDRVFV